MKVETDRTNLTVEEVFTPSQPATHTFVERYEINERLVNSLRTPGTQLVLYGHSRCGKTTLICNKLEQLYESEIITSCQGLTFDLCLLDAFDQLNPFYTTELSKEEQKTISAQTKADYKLIKLQIDASLSESTQITDTRALPLQLTPQNLARFLGEANCCWVLDDFPSMKEGEIEHLEQVMKVFVDESRKHPTLKIIAIGAVNSPRKILMTIGNIQERVDEIYVPLMPDNELSEIISKGEELLNISFGEHIKRTIVVHSNGRPSTCHKICLNMCHIAGLTTKCQENFTFNNTHFEKALQLYVDNASDSVRARFGKACGTNKQSKYQNTRLILEALSVLSPKGATFEDIFKEIKSKIPTYPRNNLERFLNELQTSKRGNILRFDPLEKSYTFSESLDRTFAMNILRHGLATHQAVDVNLIVESILEIPIPVRW